MGEKSASFPSRQSTETHIGVKLALQSWQACRYFLFLSNSADSNTSGGIQEWYEGASVSTTQVSNRASPYIEHADTTNSQICYQRTMFIIGCLLNNWFMVHQTPNQERQIPEGTPRTLLRWRVTRSPKWQSRAWSMPKVAPDPSQFPGRFSIGFLYIIGLEHL